MRQIFLFRRSLGPLTLWMIRVACSEEGPVPCCRYKKHPVPTRVGRSIGDTVLDNMNVNSWPKGIAESCLLSAFHDLFYREICPLRLLAMKQGSCNPDLVCHFNVCLDNGFSHRALLLCKTSLQSN